MFAVFESLCSVLSFSAFSACLYCSYVTLSVQSVKLAENVIRPRKFVWSKEICSVMSIVLFFVFILLTNSSETKGVFTRISQCLGVLISQTNSIFLDHRTRLPSKTALAFAWLPVYSILSTFMIAKSIQSYCQAGGYSLEFAVIICTAITSILTAIFSALSITLSEVSLRRPAPLEFSVNLLEYVTFSFLNPLVDIGREKESLEVEDIPTMIDDDCSESVFENICAHLVIIGPRSNLARKLFALIKTDVISQGVFQLVTTIASYSTPLAVQSILLYTSSLTDPDDSTSPSQSARKSFALHPAIAAALLFIGPLVKAICFGQNYLRGRRVAVRMRAALISLIYKKALSVDTALLVDGSGFITNLASVDVNEVQDFITYFNFTWCSLLEMAITLVLLYLVLGVSSLGGVAVMILSSPFSGIATKYLDKFQKEMLKIKDERMGVMNEVLGGIRIIKWFAWEENFAAKVSGIRQHELRALRSYVLCNAVLKINLGLVPSVVGVVTFLVHTQIMHQELTASAGFTALLLFNMMRRPMENIPDMANSFIKARVSFMRIVSFLALPDIPGLPRLQSSDNPGLPQLHKDNTGLSQRQNDSTGLPQLQSSDMSRLLQPSHQPSPVIATTRSVTSVTNSTSVSVPATAPHVILTLTQVTLAWPQQLHKEDVDTAAAAAANSGIFSAQGGMCSCFRSLSYRVGDDSEVGSISSTVRLARCWRCVRVPVAALVSCLAERRRWKQQLSTCFKRTASSSASPTTRSSTLRSTRYDKLPQAIDDGDGIEDSAQAGTELTTVILSKEHVLESVGAIETISDGGMRLTLPDVVVLAGVNMSVPQGSLVAVVGSTGSGKSSLISGLLGECKLLGGDIKMDPTASMSIVTQSAWIQNASLRDNILFGMEYEEERYKKVVRACALEVDLSLLKDGDMTDIGEKGVNLSGGQQQRVSLARAAYSRSQIIILDDPLSAVDAHVGDQIFRELICGFLQDRTRILVTHQVALVVPEATLILCLDGLGGVAVCCPPAELGDALTRFITAKTRYHRKTDAADSADDSSSQFGFFEMLKNICAGMDAERRNAGATSVRMSPASSPRDRKDSRDGAAVKNDVVLLVGKESKAVGSAGLHLYKYYLEACGGLVAVCLIILSNVFVPAAWFFLNYSLGEWMSAMEQHKPKRKLHTALVVYLLSVTLVGVATLFKYVYQVFASMRASRVLHGGMLDRVIGATVGWHDTQPTGRKINRFSQDINTIDTNTMNRLQDFLDCMISLAQIIVVIGWAVPLMIPILFPVLLYNAFIARKYIRVSRELKRLESINKSPVFVLFSESLAGLSVIRAFRHESKFLQLCFDRVDVMNRCHYYMWATNRWLNFRSQCMGAVVSGSVAVFVLLEAKTIGSTVAGLALIYSLSFTENLTFMTRMHAEVQMSMNSVERIIEYSTVEQEQYVPADQRWRAPRTPSLGVHHTRKNELTSAQLHFYPPKIPSSPLELSQSISNPRLQSNPRLHKVADMEGWPTVGSIEFNRVSLQYRPSTPPVLKEVSFRVEAGMKVGVCGRSGAGKSSLIAALFRTVEPSGGELVVGGINILHMPLKLLRSSLAIVPQEPVLFRGTIKSNLDPFSESDDDSLWAALRKVHMAAHVASMPGGSGREEGSLEEKVVVEKGSNLSVGQRQLLCMARAILRHAKILILDEATASVDAETDSLIQETVREELGGVTVLSIAHRLHTIAFYDKVLVMDKGEVAEYDAPHALLQNKASIFYSMCDRSGELETIAEVATMAFAGRAVK